MSAAQVTLWNAALSRQNGNLITGTDFGTGISTDGLEKNLAFLNYEQIVSTALQDSPWRFARKTAAMTLVVDGGGVPVPPIDTDYRYQWTLPADVLLLRTVISRGQPIDYQIDSAGVVLANAKTNLYAVYTYRAAESLFPPDFNEAITRMLEALYLHADERTAEAQAREKAAGQALLQAALNHAQEEAPKDPRRIPLVAVRRFGYGSCAR